VIQCAWDWPSAYEAVAFPFKTVDQAEFKDWGTASVLPRLRFTNRAASSLAESFSAKRRILREVRETFEKLDRMELELCPVFPPA
jgi:hypothetical protein